MENLESLIRNLVRLPSETSWVEFKLNCYDAEMIGQRLCAIANAAVLDDRRVGYIIWGVDDVTHEIKGTTEDFPTVKVDGKQELEPWIRQRLSRNADFRYNAVEIDGVKAVLEYPAPSFEAVIEPIALNDPKIIQVWGNQIIRIRLIAEKLQEKATYKFRICY
jgi:predicted HTH transcriptional regulator